MPRWAWNLEGRRWKTLRADVIDLYIDLMNGLGKSRARKAARKIQSAERAIDTVKCKLDTLVARQHPEWEEFTHVFYGDFAPLPFQDDGTIDYSWCTKAELGESP